MNTRFSWSVVFRFCLGLVGVLPAGSAFAQSSDTTMLRSVSISIVSFGNVPKGIEFQDGNKVVAPAIVPYARSAPFQYSGGAPFVLFKETTDANGQPVRVTLATVNYPATWKKILIVLSAGARGGPLYAQAFDDGDDAFPAGHIRLLNFHPQTIAVSTGSSVQQIVPGQSREFALPALDDHDSVLLKLAIQRNDQWQELPPWSIQTRPTIRVLVFAYEKTTQNGLQSFYLTIREALPPPKPKSMPSDET